MNTTNLTLEIVENTVHKIRSTYIEGDIPKCVTILRELKTAVELLKQQMDTEHVELISNRFGEEEVYDE